MIIKFYGVSTGRCQPALLAAISAFFLACCLALPHGVLAQEQDKLAQAQQELIQKVQQAQQDRTLISQVKELLEFILEKPKDDPSKVGGARGGDTPGVLPQGKVLTGTPAFRWQPVPEAQEYRVMVRRNDCLVWKRQTKESRLLYPADQAALNEGAYNLIVAPLGKGPLPAVTISFAVPSDAARQAVTDQAAALQKGLQRVLTPAETLLLVAKLYGQKGYLTAALATLEAAQALAPQNQLIIQALKEAQEVLGMTGSASGSS